MQRYHWEGRLGMAREWSYEDLRSKPPCHIVSNLVHDRVCDHPYHRTFQATPCSVPALIFLTFAPVDFAIDRPLTLHCSQESHNPSRRDNQQRLEQHQVRMGLRCSYGWLLEGPRLLTHQRILAMLHGAWGYEDEIWRNRIRRGFCYFTTVNTRLGHQ